MGKVILLLSPPSLLYSAFPDHHTGLIVSGPHDHQAGHSLPANHLLKSCVWNTVVKDTGLTWVCIPALPLIISYVTSVSRLNFSEHSLSHAIKVPPSSLRWELKGTMQVRVLTEASVYVITRKYPGFNSKLNSLPNYYSETLAILRIFVLYYLYLTISVSHSSQFWGLLCPLALKSQRWIAPIPGPEPTWVWGVGLEQSHILSR